MRQTKETEQAKQLAQANFEAAGRELKDAEAAAKAAYQAFEKAEKAATIALANLEYAKRRVSSATDRVLSASFGMIKHL